MPSVSRRVALREILSYTDEIAKNLHTRRAAVGARIVRGFAGTVLVQHRGAGVAHDVGIGVRQHINLVAG
jgi:hypothetical protein